MDNRMNQLIQGALILTIAGIISKVLSAFYRIPIQNLTGDVGFYLYQQIYPFIATVIILTLYSFPAAISKMGAAMGDKRHHFRYFVLPNIIILFILNGLFALIMILFAPLLANLSGEADLLLAYRNIAICFLFVPLVALFRGLFQADGDMRKTAFSQVIEQIFRVSLIIFVSYYIFAEFLPRERIAVYGVIATTIGLMVATVYLFFSYMRYRQKLQIEPLEKELAIPYRYYLHTMIVFGFAVTMNHMIFVIIQLVDVISVVPLLEQSGLSPLEAMNAKGVFDRSVPVIQLGIVVGSAFALSFVPFLARDGMTEPETNQIIRDAIAISVYLAIGATVGLFVLFPEANVLLFNDMKGMMSIRIFIIAIGLLVLLMTINAILQSYGDVVRTAIYISSLFVIKLCLNYLLIPVLGMNGAAIAAIISLLIISLLTIQRLRRKWGHLSLFSHVNWFVLCMASICMVAVLMGMKLISPLEMSRALLCIYVLAMIGVGAAVFVGILLRYHAITPNQLAALPLSSKWLSLQNILAKKLRKDDK